MDNFLTQNWWSVALVVIVSLYYFLKFAANSHAKVLALQYLYAASKLTFETSDLKLNFVTQVAYAALPKVVKTFIPNSVFSILVSTLYQQVKGIVEELRNNADSVKPQAALPTAAPAQPAEVKPVEKQAEQKQAK